MRHVGTGFHRWRVMLRECGGHSITAGPQMWLARGGTTVLKVGGGQILRAKLAEIFFDPQLFGQWGTKYCLDIAKSCSLIRMFAL